MDFSISACFYNLTCSMNVEQNSASYSWDYFSISHSILYSKIHFWIARYNAWQYTKSKYWSSLTQTIWKGDRILNSCYLSLKEAHSERMASEMMHITFPSPLPPGARTIWKTECPREYRKHSCGIRFSISLS